ncbi:MAG: hypothetical protein ACRD7E_29505 [Bryobacteraceae bacterium]
MVTVQPFTPEWSAAVRDFNNRLLRGGLDEDLQFPSEPKPEFAAEPGALLEQEFFLITEEQTVRGAYFLTHEPWMHRGEPCMVANYRLPLSEGLVNPAYVPVSSIILRDALKRQPHLYCLGMGGYDRPLPKTLKALKWPMFTTPFFFRSVRPGRVLRNIHSVRRSAARRLILDLAAFSGAGWLGISLAQRMRYRPASKGKEFSVSVAEDFGRWADDLWERVRSLYVLLAVRNSEVLRIRYPSEDERFTRLQICKGSETAGWAILLNTQMRGHQHFGNLKVGTIVDCLARPEHAGIVVQAATEALEQRGADVIISNQSHEAWCEAFRNSGFLEGPSNRIFAASPLLAKKIEPFMDHTGQLHLTRGDAAGPIHL